MSDKLNHTKSSKPPLFVYLSNASINFPPIFSFSIKSRYFLCHAYIAKVFISFRYHLEEVEIHYAGMLYSWCSQITNVLSQNKLLPLITVIKTNKPCKRSQFICCYIPACLNWTLKTTLPAFISLTLPR